MILHVFSRRNENNIQFCMTNCIFCYFPIPVFSSIFLYFVGLCQHLPLAGLKTSGRGSMRSAQSWIVRCFHPGQRGSRPGIIGQPTKGQQDIYTLGKYRKIYVCFFVSPGKTKQNHHMEIRSKSLFQIRDVQNLTESRYLDMSRSPGPVSGAGFYLFSQELHIPFFYKPMQHFFPKSLSY